MNKQDRYDSLLRYYAEKYNLNWKIIKNQMLAESSANPKATSPVGAMGLMQFMPDTWEQWGDGDPYNPEESIKAGCAYMAHLYSCYPEIPDEMERYKHSLAAYNCGRGHWNKCLAIARKASGQPYSYKIWVDTGKPNGPWQKFNYSSQFLKLITGNHANETINYVKKITGGL